MCVLKGKFQLGTSLEKFECQLLLVPIIRIDREQSTVTTIHATTLPVRYETVNADLQGDVRFGPPAVQSGALGTLGELGRPFPYVGVKAPMIDADIGTEQQVRSGIYVEKTPSFAP